MRTVNIILISIIIIIAFAGEFVASLELQPIEQPFKKEIIAIDNKLDFYKDYDRIVKIYDKEHDYNITIESTQIMQFDPVNKLKWSYDFAGEDILYSPLGLNIQDNKVCSDIPTKYIIKYNIGYVSRVPIYNCIFYPDGKTSEKDTSKISFTTLDKNNIRAEYLDNYDPWTVQTGDSNGLVLWLRFDNNYTDEAGTQESFTVYNDANFSTFAKIGTHSGYFDGTNDKIMADSISFDLDTDSSDTLPFLLSAWIYTNQRGSGGSGTVISTQNGQDMVLISDGRLQHGKTYNGTADNTLQASNAYVNNTWTHFVIFHNDTHTCHIINATIKNCESRPGSLINGQANGYLALGEARYGSNDYIGYIDDVCIWHNTTFNLTLIEDLYTAGVSGTSCGDWYMSLSGEACTPNWLNTSWSAWTNDTQCNDTTPTYNQSRYLTQYDNNTCAGSTNTTHYEYNTTITCTECVPQYTNTSWSAWANITACNGTHLIQQRNLTQYPTILCIGAINTTHFENQTVTCENCTESFLNTTWKLEGYLSSCYLNDSRITNYSRIQYDSNYCGLTANITHVTSNLTYCNNCSYSLTYTAWSNVSESCGIRYFNDTNWLQCGNVTGLASDLYGNDTVNIQYTYNETLVCSATTSLSAEQASCILNGTYTDGTYCAIGRANMGGLAITIFMLSVAGALLITPRIIKQFHEHWFPDLIIRRGLVIVGIYTMVLASATMATISEAYGLGLERTFMYTFIPVFGWVGYILMIWLGFQAIVDATKMYKDKRAEEYGWK